MIEFFKAFTLATLVITAWTALMLLQDPRGIKGLNRWFAAFLLCLTAPHLDVYLSLSTQSQGVLAVSLIACSLLWLKGPFMLAFIQVLRLGQVQSRWIGLHFVAWAMACLYSFWRPEQLALIALAGMCHMLMYLALAAGLLRARQRLILIWSDFPNTAYYWLVYILLSLMALVAIDLVVMALVRLGRLQSFGILDFAVFPCFSIFVLSIAVLSLYRPRLIFRGIETHQEHTWLDAQAPSDQAISGTRSLELNASTAESLSQHLLRLMEGEQLFRRNELSLAELADALGTSAHQLSELLNVHLGRSFYSLLNDYRIRYACQMLQDPTCQLRILDIAFEAGFNNKNSFNRAFKAATGQTPNVFRAQAEIPAAQMAQ